MTSDEVPVLADLPSSESRQSTPSGDTLSCQLHAINQDWMQQPIPVPAHIAKELVSSESTTPSWEQLTRQLNSGGKSAAAGLLVSYDQAFSRRIL